MSRPLVSVVIPAYNCAATLGGALTGALTQTYPHIEVVVVNDGSTDETSAIAHATPGVRVIDIPNGGVSAARNRGVAEASGEFIAVCDSDDVLLPSHVEAAMALLEGAPATRAAVSCNAFVLGPDGIDRRRTLMQAKDPRPEDQRYAMLQSHWTSYLSVAPRAFFADDIGYDSTLRRSEDWELWIRRLFQGWVVVRQATPTALYRVTAGSLSSDRGLMTDSEDEVMRRVVQDYQGRLTPREAAYLERRLALGSPLGLAAEADAALARGDAETARRRMSEAAELVPRETKVVAKARILRAPGGAAALRWVDRRRHTPS
ncbi:MAG: glycosyltransferase family 2 protein [Micrococcales bacterium]|nr:glycosyltransferase family 2 protein [Micrococcales bacterium]